MMAVWDLKLAREMAVRGCIERNGRTSCFEEIVGWFGRGFLHLRSRHRFGSHIPVSALSGLSVNNHMPKVMRLEVNWKCKISVFCAGRVAQYFRYPCFLKLREDGYSSKTAILSKRVVMLLSNNALKSRLEIIFAILVAQIVPKWD